MSNATDVCVCVGVCVCVCVCSSRRIFPRRQHQSAAAPNPFFHFAFTWLRFPCLLILTCSLVVVFSLWTRHLQLLFIPLFFPTSLLFPPSSLVGWVSAASLSSISDSLSSLQALPQTAADRSHPLGIRRWSRAGPEVRSVLVFALQM